MLSRCTRRMPVASRGPHCMLPPDGSADSEREEAAVQMPGLQELGVEPLLLRGHRAARAFRGALPAGNQALRQERMQGMGQACRQLLAGVPGCWGWPGGCAALQPQELPAEPGCSGHCLEDFGLPPRGWGPCGNAGQGGASKGRGRRARLRHGVPKAQVPGHVHQEHGAG
mmetsp:Transcript_28608/g.91190  ORF Transcript_28608/g.91190 Transcript_28608/m.91190 type:complete len:170 (+) Transcript_28608:310-819(+)